MSPAEYVNIYLNLSCWIGEAFVATRVRNYLQDGKAPQSPQAKQAFNALVPAVRALAGLRPGTSLPAVFDVSGDKYVGTSLQRVFLGKGAPDEIQDVLWLASLCGLLDEGSVANYADTNLGVDCGGFVANYWGIGHPSANNPNPSGATGFLPRTIWNTYRTHRKDAGSVAVGDAAVFFKDVKANNPDLVATKKLDGTYDTSTGSQAFHIGLVASASVGYDGTMRLEIAESSGAAATSRGNGVNVRSVQPAKPVVAGGLVYCPDGNNRIYFTGAPSSASPYLPQWYGA